MNHKILLLKNQNNKNYSATLKPTVFHSFSAENEIHSERFNIKKMSCLNEEIK